MDLGLKDKRIAVTGASRGIGRAIALALASEGTQLALLARGESDLNACAEAVRERGGRAVTVVADVATAVGARAAVDAATAALGGLDGLVNNAGGSLSSGAFDVATADDWTRVVDLNLMSAVWCSQAAMAPLEASGGGVIVHVSSICGLEHCTSAPYTAAKGAIASLTKEMGIDLARKKVRVVAVAPGSIMFPGGSWDKRKRAMPDRIEKMVREELPWGRFGTPEEIADVVTFALSSRASWVTGTTWVVDGGQGRAV